MSLWSLQKYLLLWRLENLLYSSSVERCIFQGGGLASTILSKSIIHYQTLQIQSHKSKKNYGEMIASTWKINLEIVAYLLIEILELFIWNKSKQKSNFYLILCLFLHDTFPKIERDGKLVRKRCQNFTFLILSRWLYEDITCSGLLINTKQKAADT